MRLSEIDHCHTMNRWLLKCGGGPEEEGEVPEELGDAVDAEGVDQVAREEAEPTEHERAAHNGDRLGCAALAFGRRALLLLRRLRRVLVLLCRLLPAEIELLVRF